MSSLKDLQDSFQRGILAGDDAILGEVNDSATEQRTVLFGVYRYAYVARLAEILGEDYEQGAQLSRRRGLRQIGESLYPRQPVRPAQRAVVWPPSSRLRAGQRAVRQPSGGRRDCRA